eukprot:Gregarina_sp_Poly_1__2930@NODE_181_length_11831_cov_65_262326_g161_i0_p4_GENE_NODE_181_length_11831_cov_65_262326_g161_i0NODE_181_length_11831_cov_65_262326_g161_i0_p4_ORF_typecomplete_len392_score32_87Leu_Phe_trans/PF03588_14/6e32_NODE_181_length_11831_cov_65_262326_g161_i034344609
MSLLGRFPKAAELFSKLEKQCGTDSARCVLSFDSLAELPVYQCPPPQGNEFLINLNLLPAQTALEVRSIVATYVAMHYGILEWSPDMNLPAQKLANIFVKRNFAGQHVWTFDLTPNTLRDFTMQGFLCMGLNVDIESSSKMWMIGLCLPKLHRNRCVIKLAEVPKPQKSTVKRLNRYELTIDTDFDGVCNGLRNQHGVNNWVHVGLERAYKSLKQGSGADGTDLDLLIEGEADASELKFDRHSETPTSRELGAAGQPKWHSIELRRNNALVAGELGVTVGGCYTSLSGFHTESGAGVTQLLALKLLLMRLGFTLWDLGMHFDYKVAEGAQSLPRQEWLALFRSTRGQKVGVPRVSIEFVAGINASPRVSSRGQYSEKMVCGQYGAIPNSLV